LTGFRKGRVGLGEEDGARTILLFAKVTKVTDNDIKISLCVACDARLALL
jgi:hypothetical protein